jgi:hypothetical protein
MTVGGEKENMRTEGGGPRQPRDVFLSGVRIKGVDPTETPACGGVGFRRGVRRKGEQKSSIFT